MAEIDARLREEVHLLGELLGDTISNQLGEAFRHRVDVDQHGAALAAEAGRKRALAGPGIAADHVGRMAEARRHRRSLAQPRCPSQQGGRAHARVRARGVA